MTGFGASALILAMIGLYGVVAFSVHQRRQEFGIRRALGASPSEIVQLVMGEGMRMTIVSLAIGAALAVLAGRALSRFLYEISPFDGITLGATVLVLGLATLAACFAPARRASNVEPRVALEE